MKPEIERKFRLNPVPAILQKLEGTVPILQGYLETPDSFEIRVRAKGDNEFTLGTKNQGNLVRLEWEVPIPKEVWGNFWDVVKDRIYKKRRIIPYRGYKLEVDYYLGRLYGLTVVECEFVSTEEAEAFRLPDWLARVAVEVTDDPRYKNRNLAKLESLQELSV